LSDVQMPPTALEMARLLAAALVADLRQYPDTPPADDDAFGDNRQPMVEDTAGSHPRRRKRRPRA